MGIIFYAAMIYGLMCIYEIARGGGYRFSEPKDAGDIVSRLVYNPMVELRQRGYFYIRDEIFAGLFLTPIFYAPFVIHNHLSWYFLPAVIIGWTFGGLRGWGTTLLQMGEFKNFWPSFLRCLEFGGVFFLPWGINHNLSIIWQPIAETIILAALIPILYYICYRFIKNDYQTNYAEFAAGAVIAGMSLI